MQKIKFRLLMSTGSKEDLIKMIKEYYCCDKDKKVLLLDNGKVSREVITGSLTTKQEQYIGTRWIKKANRYRYECII